MGLRKRFLKFLLIGRNKKYCLERNELLVASLPYAICQRIINAVTLVEIIKEWSGHCRKSSGKRKGQIEA
jgi:hypothetical protein